MTLRVARDAFGKHPDQLADAELPMLAEMIALAMIEAEELERSRQR